MQEQKKEGTKKCGNNVYKLHSQCCPRVSVKQSCTSLLQTEQKNNSSPLFQTTGRIQTGLCSQEDRLGRKICSLGRKENISVHGPSPQHHPVGAHPKPGSISHCPTLSRNELLRGCILCLTVCSHAANV